MNLDFEYSKNGFFLFDGDYEIAESVIITVLKETEFDDDAFVSLSIVDNKKIRYLNREYRGIDSETDVLSFVQYDENFEFDVCEGESVFLGDIVISYDKLKEQALEYGHGLEREFAYLICHSVLHLLGYDHEEESDKLEMRKMEEQVLGDLGYTR